VPDLAVGYKNTAGNSTDPADVHEDDPENTVRRCMESSKIDRDRLCSHPHASLALFDDEVSTEKASSTQNCSSEVTQEANANVDEIILSGEWRACASHFTQAEKTQSRKF